MITASDVVASRTLQTTTVDANRKLSWRRAIRHQIIMSQIVSGISKGGNR